MASFGRKNTQYRNPRRRQQARPNGLHKRHEQIPKPPRKRQQRPQIHQTNHRTHPNNGIRRDSPTGAADRHMLPARTSIQLPARGQDPGEGQGTEK